MHRNLPAVFVISGTNNIRAAAYHGGRLDIDLGHQHRDLVPGLDATLQTTTHNATTQVDTQHGSTTPASTTHTTQGLTAEVVPTATPDRQEGRSLVQVQQEEPTLCPRCRINPELLPNKFLYFAFTGGLGCALPYVAIYLKQIGLSPQQIGLISGLKPIIGFLSGPVWGAIGDRFRIQRWLLMVSIAAWLAFYLGLFCMPGPGRLAHCDDVRPHRNSVVKRAVLNSSIDALGVNSNGTTSLPLTAEEEEILREDLGWVYDGREVTRVFVTALFLIAGGELFQSPTSSLSDAVTLHTLGTDKLDHYGAQRAWGALGWATASLLGGGIVSHTRREEEVCGVQLYFSDYRIIGYVFIAFMALTFLASFGIKFKKSETGESAPLEMHEGSPAVFDEVGETPRGRERPAGNKVHVHSALAVVRMFRNVHYGSWIFTAFAVGCMNGLIWGFLYWHLENLGADQLMMAADSVVMCLAEFVTFFFVGRIIRWVGHMGIMYLGLAGYSIRFCVYGMITNPWWAIPADLLQGITFSCVWVSLTSYTALSVPAVSLGTIQGILHGVYFGLGTGTGHLLGGVMIGAIGAQLTFFCFAAGSAVVLLIFIACQKCSVKPERLEFEYKDLDDPGA